MTKTIGVTMLLLCFGISYSSAQSRLAKLQIQEVHVVNNIGWGIPLGQSREVLSPKYSSSLGLDVLLDGERYFLYPFLDFLSFDYDQKVADPSFEYQLENGRSNLYVLNLAAGARKRNKQWGIYGFAGPGLAMMTEPRATVQAATKQVVLKNHILWTPTVRGGAGIDYRIGNVFIFVEGGYLYNFRQMQSRPMHFLSVYGGLKTNVTRVADRVVEIIGDRSPE